jgi:hypothetical protein
MQQQQQDTIAGMLYIRRQKHQQRKRRQFWVHVYSSRVTFQLMFTHDFVSIEQLLRPVVWTVVASYNWKYDQSLIATTSSTIINRTIDLFLFHLIVRLMYHRSSTTYRRGVAIHDRLWKSCRLVVFRSFVISRAIRCDWGFTKCKGTKYIMHLQVKILSFCSTTVGTGGKTLE